MKKPVFLIIILALGLLPVLNAQTIYADAVKGNSDGNGSITSPFQSLEKAVAMASGLSGNEPVTIKVAPGLYTIYHQLELKTAKQPDDVRYTIEASILPDHPDWAPALMPVIQSVSGDNSTTQFTHCIGMLAGKSNITIRGLKFIGNPNQSVRYYYPIVRENENYKGLEISQCYFIGEKNSSAIQGAVYASGAGIHIDHCIFNQCKNALLLFSGISDFSITHSIINGSYESAVWFGPLNAPFTFENNIVTNCNFFWVGPEKTQQEYVFSNSVITDNTQYMGNYGSMGLTPAASANKEKGIIKTGKVILSEVMTQGIPKDHLNPLPESAGKALGAGIFKTKK